MSFESITDILGKHPLPGKRLSYGTAGFRDRHDILSSVFVRVGILAALRSKSTGGKCIGIMITASHNPEVDNGVKLIDPDGGMLMQVWEPHAETLANVDIAHFAAALNQVIVSEKIDTNVRSSVALGRDTRPHSHELSVFVELGLSLMDSIVYQVGEVTTPQLHYVVNKINTSSNAVNATDYLNDYYTTLAGGYADVLSTVTIASNVDVTIDASYGVGSIALEIMQASLNQKLHNSNSIHSISFNIRNKCHENKVNEGCGAELVQKNQIAPCNFNAESDHSRLLCSFDGDADRIVFHGYLPIINNNGAGNNDFKWILLDGDKIAALISSMLCSELKITGLDKKYTIGVIQTAYANGASTRYLKSQGIHVDIAKTGVKYVHHKAIEYDMGVYFEANGHGTVVFSERLTQAILAVDCNNSNNASKLTEREIIAYRRLQASLRLINQTVGDAISDMLCCLASLQILGMDLFSWDAMYTDVPSKQMKVVVKDKSLVTCSEDETRVIRPIELQLELDEAMKTVALGRCFIRPSGTEDVVRIYAEAETKVEADHLAELAKSVILKYLS